MKSAVENVSALERKLNVSIPATRVEETFERIYKNIQKNAHLKGFRPGKAPMNVVKSTYQARAIQDAVQDLVSKAWSEALRQHQLQPINEPEFEFEAPLENKDFEFSVHFEVRPQVELKKFEGLVVEKEKFEFDEKSVDRVFENMRQAKAQNVDVLEDRPAREGDIAVIDFDGFVDGQPLENGSSQNFELELGSKSFIDGFEEGLVGISINQERTLSLQFPEKYSVAQLQGKPVEFKVKLKGLKKKELPELNDDFVKSFGGNDSLNELRERIRKDLVDSETKRIENDFRDRLLKKLVKENPVPVPPSFLEEQKQSLLQNAQRRMMEQGMNEQDFAEYAKKWDSDFAETASQMVQASFLVDTLSQQKNLMWTDEDMEKRIAEYSQQTGLPLDKVQEFYSRPEQKQRLAFMITEDKVVRFLTESAVIREVPKAQLK